MNASLAHIATRDLLEEIARRIGDDAADAVPHWARPILEAVAACRRCRIQDLMARRGRATARLATTRHLAISILTARCPDRTQAEIAGLFGNSQALVIHARRETAARIIKIPAISADWQSIHARLDAQAHCRTSPQGISDARETSAA